MNNPSLHLRMHYRKRLRESIAEIIAYRVACMPDQVLGGILVHGAYPNYRIEIDEIMVPMLMEYTICFEPCFEEPSILGAMRKNYGNA